MPSVSNYNLAYWLETDDIYGKKYRLEISAKDGSVQPDPTPQEIVAQSEFVEIRWGGSSSSDKPTNSRIIGSRMSVNLWGIGGIDFEDLFSAKEQQYLVELYRRITVEGSEVTLLMWKGFIVPDAYVQEIKDINSSVNFYAADGLALTDNDFLDDDFEMIDGVKLEELFDKYIEKTGLEFDLFERMGYKKQSSPDYSSPIMSQLGINLNSFTSDGSDLSQKTSYKEAITSILSGFNSRIYQASDGRLWIHSLMSENADSGLDGGLYKAHKRNFGSASWEALINQTKSTYVYSIKNDFVTSANSLIKTLEPTAKEVFLRYNARPINCIYNGQIVVANEFSNPPTVKGWELNDPKAIVSSRFSASKGKYSILLNNYAARYSDEQFNDLALAEKLSGVGNLFDGSSAPSAASWKLDNIIGDAAATFKFKCLYENIAFTDNSFLRFSLEFERVGNISLYYNPNTGVWNDGFSWMGFQLTDSDQGEWRDVEFTLNTPSSGSGEGRIVLRVHPPNFNENGSVNLFFDDFFFLIYPTSGNVNDYNPKVVQKVYASTNEDVSSDVIDDEIGVGTTEYADELTGKVQGQYWDYDNDEYLSDLTWLHKSVPTGGGQPLERYVQSSYLRIYGENLVRYEGSLIDNRSGNTTVESRSLSPNDFMNIDYDSYSDDRNLLITDLEFNVKRSEYNFRAVATPRNETIPT